MRDHRQLKVFHLADRLAVELYAATQNFPRHEQFGLTSQLRRAAVSIATNIVEGSARSTQKDYAHFLSIAYSSSKELQYEISLSRRLGYFKEDVVLVLEDLVDQTSRALCALVSAMQR